MRCSERFNLRFLGFVVACFCSFILAMPLFSQESETSSEEPKAEQARLRLEYMFDSASGFEGVRKSDGAKLKIYENPLLRFTNPIFGCRDGIFVAWVDPKNRPVAVGQVFLMRNTDNRWYIETQSCSDSPIELRSSVNGAWSPKDPGIKWTAFEGGQTPAGSERLRLTQMRQLARRFHAEDFLVREEETNLRLMPSPMIRYEDTEMGILDGALFAYVQGTDPELLVQLEARKEKDGTSKFYWALVAMTSGPVNAFLDDKPVWSKERSSGSSSSTFFLRSIRGGVPYPLE